MSLKDSNIADVLPLDEFKHISPSELAEIINGVLLTPEKFGMDKGPSRLHTLIMEKLGEVIASNLGGSIVAAIADLEKPIDEPLSSDDTRLLVRFDHVVKTDFNGGKMPWDYYDKDAWQDEDIRPLHDHDDDSIEAFRQDLRSVLIERSLSQGQLNKIKTPLKGWGEGSKDAYSFAVEFNGSGVRASWSDPVDPTDPLKMDVLMEVDKGLPAMHIASNGFDNSLHIHQKDGIHLSPEDEMQPNNDGPYGEGSYSLHEEAEPEKVNKPAPQLFTP